MNALNNHPLIKVLSIICAILAALASIVAIYKFVSGQQSLFPGTTTVNATLTPTPTAMVAPTPDTTPLSDNGSVVTNSIDYTFSTWECWIGIGLLVGCVAGGGAGYRSSDNDFGGLAAGGALGCMSGIVIAILVGFIASIIINSLDISDALLWDLGITAFTVFCVSRFVGHAIGNEC